MSKTILITGATDGIGKLTAELLASQGHLLLLHGRNAAKLARVAAAVGGTPGTYVADLSRLDEVMAMASAIRAEHESLDVLINNAGVLNVKGAKTPDGLDVRFVVNTIAPYLLTRRLLSMMPKDGRVVNVSSAAQAPVDGDALAGGAGLADMEAYAQSKLAITLWTQALAKELTEGPMLVAVNPGSLLASKMVKEGFGVPGNDLRIGANILCKAALDPAFDGASGKYFDNDAGRFGAPHSAANDPQQIRLVMDALKRFDRG